MIWQDMTYIRYDKSPLVPLTIGIGTHQVITELSLLNFSNTYFMFQNISPIIKKMYNFYANSCESKMHINIFFSYSLYFASASA